MGRRGRVLVAVAVAGAVTAAGCGRSRAGYEAEFKRLVAERGDLSTAEVDCIVGGLFAGMSDAELKAFSEREELTDDERFRIGELTAVCRNAN